MTKLIDTLYTHAQRTALCLVALFALANASLAQNDSVQNLYFVKKGEAVVFDSARDYLPGKNAFYIYRNCVYTLVVRRQQQITIRVVDIRNDSIYYTPYYGTRPDQYRTDIFSLHPSHIKLIRSDNNQVIEFTAGYAMSKSRFVFEKSQRPKAFKKIIDTVYSKDSSGYTWYELVPHLTNRGLERTQVRYGHKPSNDEIAEARRKDSAWKNRPPVVKNGVWFTPSRATTINGLNVGLWTSPLNDRAVAINGVNLNADVVSGVLGILFIMYTIGDNKLSNMPDTISKHESEITGLSLSAGGVIGDVKMHGVSLNGGVYQSASSRGLVMTGTINTIEEFNGVIVSGLRNKSIKGKGLQIGLLNVCKHMKGVQIGLWNVNSKRKLPFINWCFSS